MTRRKSFQKGSVTPRNGVWTLRFRELDHYSGEFINRREVLGKFKDKKSALEFAAPIMAEVNKRNN